jgi:hypothetical protein
MSGDRSLDEFAAGSTDGDASATGTDAGGDEAPDATADDAAGGDGVDPATSTYAWSPSGATCTSCGATVERRWRDDDALVCDDCKSW